MVRSRIAGHVGIKIIAERELLSVSPVLGDIGLLVLLADGHSRAREPGRVVVAERSGGRIGSVRQRVVSIRAGEGAKVAVEGVVLLQDDDHVFHRTLGDRARARGRSRWRAGLGAWLRLWLRSWLRGRRWLGLWRLRRPTLGRTGSVSLLRTGTPLCCHCSLLGYKSRGTFDYVM